VGILQQITHPHVMRLDEFYEDAHEYALVTEMVCVALREYVK
jgi:hypothetical protein